MSTKEEREEEKLLKEHFDSVSFDEDIDWEKNDTAPKDLDEDESD